jgi:hypothetical protein
MPDYDIKHTDAVARNAGVAAANAGCFADPVLKEGHNFSINRLSPGRMQKDDTNQMAQSKKESSFIG